MPLATALQGFSNNISEVTIPTVRQQGGLCPSGAHGDGTVQAGSSEAGSLGRWSGAHARAHGITHKWNNLETRCSSLPL